MPTCWISWETAPLNWAKLWKTLDMYTYIYISCWIRFAKTYRATVDIVVSMSKLERIFAEARAIMVHYIYICEAHETTNKLGLAWHWGAHQVPQAKSVKFAGRSLKKAMVPTYIGWEDHNPLGWKHLTNRPFEWQMVSGYRTPSLFYTWILWTLEFGIRWE